MPCPTCGFPITREHSTCPKCDRDLAADRSQRPLTIDLAHHGETTHQALAKLERAVSECLWQGHPSLVVIHGHGSTTGRSSIKPHVLSSMKRHAARLGGAVLPCAGNPGATVLDFSSAPPAP